MKTDDREHLGVICGLRALLIVRTWSFRETRQDCGPAPIFAAR